MNKNVIIPSIIIVSAVLVAGIVWLVTGGSRNQAKNLQTTPSSAIEAAENKNQDQPLNMENRDGTTSKVILNNGEETQDELVIIGSNQNVKIETMSNIEPADPQKDGTATPSYYQSVEYPGTDYPIYAFKDADGNVQIRVYGKRWHLINNIKDIQYNGFFDKSIISNGKKGYEIVNGLEVSPVTDLGNNVAKPERLSSDKIPDTKDQYISIGENLFVCYSKTDEKAYRTWAKVNNIIELYPCNENGVIKDGTIPVDINEESANLLTIEIEGDWPMMRRYPGKLGNNVVLPILSNVE